MISWRVTARCPEKTARSVSGVGCPTDMSPVVDIIEVSERIRSGCSMLLLAVSASAAGAFLAMRAAYGFPTRRQAEATLEELVVRDQNRLRRACTDLRRTVVLGYASLVMVVASLAITWFA
jgi:hypothetical protein